MYPSVATANEIVSAVALAAARGPEDLFAAIEALPAPIYVTDPQGVVTHFNSACIGFAGRTPAAGKDRWCVSWKLYTETGAPLPHDQCPMALAIRDRRAVRGAVALAERPDGVRVVFMPFPTPLFGPDGRLVGAINLLLDVSDPRQVAELRAQAGRCRRLGAGMSDPATAETLWLMASEYEAKADQLERLNADIPQPGRSAQGAALGREGVFAAE
jgi:hypothetical protein